jgi:S1-C subfamily serine protease
MTNLETFSTELADRVTAAAASVVQVLGARRPASGVVYGADTIITTARAIGREDGLRVRLPGVTDATIEAELAGWDPATGLAMLRTRTHLEAPAPATADGEPRTGEVVVAIARSWSNAITASAGIVAAVGGPLRTGRRRQIARVFRVTAPMHDGFAGGGIFVASGRLAGIATASTIRGFAVGIPSAIAWAAADQVLTRGTPKRGYVGLSVQPVELPPSQQPAGRTRAIVVVGVAAGGPADTAGLIVGDVLLDFDGQAIERPDDLLDLLTDRRIGQKLVARTLRGGSEREVHITAGERPRG